MTLIYKIKRLIKSDAHALIESFEEPKFIIAQAIRDMESELEKQEQKIKTISSLVEKSKNKLSYFEKNINKLEKDIEFSFSQNRDDLAKNMVKELVKFQKSELKIRDLINESQEELDLLSQDYQSKRGDLEKVKEECESLKFEFSQSESVWDENQDVIHTSSNLENEIELEFLKRKQNFEEARS